MRVRFEVTGMISNQMCTPIRSITNELYLRTKKQTNTRVTNQIMSSIPLVSAPNIDIPYHERLREMLVCIGIQPGEMFNSAVHFVQVYVIRLFGPTIFHCPVILNFSTVHSA